MRHPAKKPSHPPRSAKAAWRRPPSWLIAALLMLVTAALYWPATTHDFVSFDDDFYVYQNPHVQGGLSWHSLQWAFGNLEAGFWHPLTWVSILLDSHIFGLHAAGHHLTSLLLHAASTALLFLALRQMTGATWRSAFAAALFGWHPLHVESVAWASERKDVLSGLFWILTLWAYARYVQARGPEPKAGVTFRASNYYVLSLGLFALGLMSKPMVVTLPIVLLLLDCWPLQRFPSKLRNLWPLIVEKVPFLLAAFAGGMITIYAEKRIGALGATAQCPLAWRFQNALLSYVAYLKQTLWPIDLAAYYPYPQSFAIGPVLAAALVVLVISILMLSRWRKSPYLAVGWMWYVVTLLPVIGVLQVGDFARADRFTYLPLIGIFVAMAWGFHELSQRCHQCRIALGLTGAAMLVVCLVTTREQIGYWKDSEALFRHALAATGDNAVAHNSLGTALVAKGRTDEAIPHYEQALRVRPDYADAHSNLGSVLSDSGRFDAAIDHYQQALRLEPNHALARYGLGNAFARKGQGDEAIYHYQQVLQHKPDYAEVHIDLGAALVQQGRTADAKTHFLEAIRLQPDAPAAHYNLANLLAAQGSFEPALKEYQQALRLKPDHVDAHNNLGVAFYQLGRLPEAIGQFQEVLRLKPDHAGARRNLEAAQAATSSRPSPTPASSTATP